MLLAQISGESQKGEYFCGGISLKDDVVVEAAPLLGFMVGKTRAQVRKVCQDFSWSVRVVCSNAPEENPDGAPVQSSPRS